MKYLYSVLITCSTHTICFLSTLRPHISTLTDTLFPYTTLFRSRDCRRHAEPLAGPCWPSHRRSFADRDADPRRSRPHARHRLHSRLPPRDRAAAQAAPEPDVLGDVLAGHQIGRAHV